MAADEDPVVAEMDVFLAQTLAEELFVLQYPLRPAYRPPAQPTAASIRWQHQSLEVKLPLPSGAHYDESASDEVRLKEATFTSTAVPLKHHTMIGLVRHGAVHLTPVAGLLQLRPTFEHLNNTETEEVEMDGDGLPAMEDDGEAEPQRVQTQFKRRESQKAIDSRKSSYSYINHRRESEPPVKLTVVPRERFNGGDPVERLVGYVDSDVAAVTHHSFVKEFEAAAKPPSTVIPAGKDAEDQPTKTEAEQSVESLLLRASVLPVKLIRAFAAGMDDVTLHQALLQIGVLLHGCWVIRSEFVFPREAGHTSRMVRDYVLWLLRESPTRSVNRAHIYDRTHHNTELTKTIVTTLCRLNPAEGRYEFKHEPDRFYDSAPEITRQSEQLWKKIIHNNPYIREEMAHK